METTARRVRNATTDSREVSRAVRFEVALASVRAVAALTTIVLLLARHVPGQERSSVAGPPLPARRESRSGPSPAGAAPSAPR